MSGNNNRDPVYVLGRSQRETERLQRQGQLLEPFTRRLFETAGITTGIGTLWTRVKLSCRGREHAPVQASRAGFATQQVGAGATNRSKSV
jgi:hypothetical protein